MQTVKLQTKPFLSFLPSPFLGFSGLFNTQVLETSGCRMANDGVRNRLLSLLRDDLKLAMVDKEC